MSDEWILYTTRLRPSRCLVGYVLTPSDGAVGCVNVNRYPTRTVAWFFNDAGQLCKAEARGKPRGKMPCVVSLTRHHIPFAYETESGYNGSEVNANQPTKETIE